MGGRSDVRSRLVGAARELLGELRPSEVTIRRIGERAGVQHSLVVRHFGSRAVLLQLVAADLLAELATEVRGAPDATAAVDLLLERVLGEPALRSLTVLVVQGDAGMGGEHPLVDALEGHLRAQGTEPDHSRRSATLIALGAFAWASAEPWWLEVMGCGAQPELGRRAVRESLLAPLAGAPPEGPREDSR